MANAFYPAGRTSIADGTLDLIANTFKVVALDATYTYNAAHTVVDDLTGTLGTATTLTGKSWLSDAVFDADDVSYPDVDPGETVRRLVFFVDTGDTATSRLVAYADTENDGTPISIDGTGAPIPILWDNGSLRIFRL